MTKEEAARILDPVTAWKELEKYGPSTEQKIQAVMEAGQIAAQELRKDADHFREVTKMVPLTLEQLQGMNGKLVWVEKYKTVGIVWIKWNMPDEPFVLFWNEEPYIHSIKGCKLKVYEYFPARIDRKAWEKPCKLCDRTDSKIMCKFLKIAEYDQSTIGRWAEANFCPECGRPLTHEAWEALEKRLRG